MLTVSLQQYQSSPLVFLMIVGLGLAFHAFALNWASNICLAQSVSYLRSGMAVIGLGVVNLIAAHLLQGQQIAFLTPAGMAAIALVSTMFLTAALPADPVNALLVLMLSTIVTAGGAYSFLAFCAWAAAVIS